MPYVNQWSTLTRFDAVSGSTSDAASPSSNTAAVITYAAAADLRHVISGIAWSYSSAPTGGNLKIEDGSGNVIFSVDITAAGFGQISFQPPKTGSVNTAMIITLTAGGSDISGKISVLGHWNMGQ